MDGFSSFLLELPVQLLVITIVMTFTISTMGNSKSTGNKDNIR